AAVAASAGGKQAASTAARAAASAREAVRMCMKKSSSFQITVSQQQPGGAVELVFQPEGLIRREPQGVPLQQLEVLPLRVEQHRAGEAGGQAHAAGHHRFRRVPAADVQVQKERLLP
ncbi:Lineage-specific thermal regulator protein, partial [Dysosmobacter welbionis]